MPHHLSHIKSLNFNSSTPKLLLVILVDLLVWRRLLSCCKTQVTQWSDNLLHEFLVLLSPEHIFSTAAFSLLGGMGHSPSINLLLSGPFLRFYFLFSKVAEIIRMSSVIFECFRCFWSAVDFTSWHSCMSGLTSKQWLLQKLSDLQMFWLSVLWFTGWEIDALIIWKLFSFYQVIFV